MTQASKIAQPVLRAALARGREKVLSLHPFGSAGIS